MGKENLKLVAHFKVGDRVCLVAADTPHAVGIIREVDTSAFMPYYTVAFTCGVTLRVRDVDLIRVPENGESEKLA